MKDTNYVGAARFFEPQLSPRSVEIRAQRSEPRIKNRCRLSRLFYRHITTTPRRRQSNMGWNCPCIGRLGEIISTRTCNAQLREIDGNSG